MKSIAYMGMDVHQEHIRAAVIGDVSGESVREERIQNLLVRLKGFGKLPHWEERRTLPARRPDVPWLKECCQQRLGARIGAKVLRAGTPVPAEPVKTVGFNATPPRYAASSVLSLS